MNTDKLKTRAGKKSIVVVLGMHRSGTSAITRGLQVLGIDLGERLMLPAERNNEKGFFEDIDVNAINIELLKELGQDWHTLTLIAADELLHEKYAGLRLRAIELLRSRLQNTDCFGLKDPRLCRLLPFWQKVFEHLQVEVSYVIAVRNPLSVAKSLEARNQIPHEKSHYLWLEHVLPSVLLTRGMRRVLVDYDLLLNNPQQQMARLALGLDSKPDPVRLAEFSRDFLDIRLRHTAYKPEDVLESPLVPYPVRTAVMLLADVAADRLSLDSEEVDGAFGNLAGQMAGMSQAMDYLLRLDNIIAGMSHVLAERNNRVAVLSQDVAERDGQIAALTQTSGEREAQVALLSQGMAERDDRIGALTQTAGEREAQLAEFSRGIAERDGRIEALTETVRERKAQMATLTQGLAERDDRIEILAQADEERKARMAVLTQGMAERDERIAVLTQAAGEREAGMAALNQGMAERDGQIKSLMQTVEERKAQMAALAQGMAERDERIAVLTQAAEERKLQMAAINQGMAERDGQIKALTQVAEERKSQMAALNQGMAERDGQIKSLMQTVEERKVQMAALAQGMAERDERIAALAQAAVEREAGMAALNQGMAERDGQVKALTQEAEERKVQMAALTQGMAERDERIAALAQAAVEREAGMAALNQGMAERDGQVKALAQEAEERKVQMAALTQGMAERDERITALTQAAVEREARITALNQDLTGRDSQIKALLQAAEERKAQMAALTQGIAERDVWIEELAQKAEEREAQTVAFKQDMAERKGQIEVLTQTAEEREAQIAALTQGMTERDGRIGALTQAAVERDAQMAGLKQGMAERDAWIEDLMHALEERKARTAALTLDTTERETQMATLIQAAGERDAQMAALNHGLAERDGRIEALLQDGSRQDMAIRQLRVNSIQHEYRLGQVRASLGWRLFKPVRASRNLLPGINRKVGVGLAPLDQLQANGAEWLATGRDGQFLLMAERAWHGLAGWYWLDMDAAAERALKAQLVFDAGEGFDPSRAIDLLFSGTGKQRVPLFVPPRCRAVRLDLFDMPEKFGLSALRMNRLAKAPDLPPEFLAQTAIYEALGGRDGNATALVPANGVQRHDEADYCWRSDGEDPWFVLQDISQKLRPGWYMIELRIRSDTARGNAKLYFDYGEGYSEAASLALPFRNGQVSKRLCHLPSVPRQVRFDPLEGEARFSVEHLHFSPVLSMFAYHRMLWRLGNRYEQYKDMSLWEIWRDLQAERKTKKVAARELLIQRYNHTFHVASGKAGIGEGYEEWIGRVETPEFSRLDALTALPESFRLQPAISVVMPVYNTAEAFLRRAIESVLSQGYPHWELCIADDASTEPHVRAVLEEYMRRDPRIKVAFREENGHISAASNSALALATGEYVALLDHDDELARHALHLVAEAVNQNPSAQILYSDEDKIDGQGKRADPHFKPDWNPDLFLSQNYVSHLGVYRRELLQRTGGFRIGVEGSQDHDLLLRCLPHVHPAGIVHIPKVLYHWRIVQGSTALACGEKSYTSGAGIKALQDFFSAQGREDVKVENGLAPNTYRIRYPIPQPEPLVSLLIPTRDKLELLEPCIRGILGKTTYRSYEIIILDNESAEPATLEFFERIQAEDSRVRVLAYRWPFNYSAINNYGVQQARGELIGLVNNDIEVISPEWLTEMVSHALRPEIGCVGAKLYYDDETIQHAGVIVGLGGVAGHSHKYFPRQSSGYFHRLKIIQNLSAVTAACLVVRKSVYEQVGGLEEDGLRIAFNDVDFCLKVREAGYRNLWTPYAELFHYESKSRGEEDTPEKVKRFNKEIEFVKTKWGELLRRDPCYSPNLTLAREDFSLEGA